MKKIDTIKELKQSNLDLAKVWTLCGTAMVLRGLRETTSDIDLGCSTKYFHELLKNKYPIKNLDNGNRSINYSEYIEIFE